MTAKPIRLVELAAALVIAATLLLALFIVPYHVPLHAPSVSDSWIFGYNNRVGIAIAFLGALLAAIFGARFLGAFTTPVETGKPLNRSSLIKALGLTALLSGLLAFATWRLDGWNESVYTVDRVRLLLEGHTLYRDFEFAYGPLLLWGPEALVRIFGLTVTGACNLFWMALNLLGIALFYYVVCWVGIARKRAIFLSLLTPLMLSVLSTGSGYSPIRFVLPLYSILLIERALRSAATSTGRAAAIALVIPAMAALLLISPEMGLAFGGAAALFLLRFGGLSKLAHLWNFCLTLLMTGGMLALAQKRGLFDTLHAFATGGFNFPIVPAVPIFTLLIAVFVASAFVGEQWREGKSTPQLGLACCAAAMLPATLGRCDGGHIWLDGLGVFLLATVAASNRRRLWPLVPALIVLVFFVLPLTAGRRGLGSMVVRLSLLSIVTHVEGAVAMGKAPEAVDQKWVDRLRPILGNEKAQLRVREAEAIRKNTDNVDVATTYARPSGTVFEAPFGFMAGHSSPYHSSTVEEGYYLSTVNLLTPAGTARKLNELAAHAERELLIPEDAERSCTREENSARSEIRSLFSYPYSRPAVHQDNILEPLCSYIRSNYQLTRRASEASLGYALWTPKKLMGTVPHGN